MPADDDRSNRPRPTEAQEASTGPAQRMDPGSRPRGTPLSKEALDARQAAISPRRKSGPPLESGARSGERPDADATPDVPPTDCADPPSE